MQTLATINGSDEEYESNEEVSRRAWETGKTQTTDSSPEHDSTDTIGSIKGTTAMTGMEEKSKLVIHEIVRGQEERQATDGGETLVSDDAASRSKAKRTEAIQLEMTRSNKDGDDGCAEHKVSMGEGNNTLEIKSTKESESPKAPKIHELREIDMQWWEEKIARHRADKKGYAQAKDINNYYVELKGVEDEIKLALERWSSGVVEGAWDGTTKRKVEGEEGKEKMERSTTKSDGAGKEKETGRVCIRKIGVKGEWTIGGKGGWIQKRSKNGIY